MIAQERQSRVFYELCALLLSILRPPPLSVALASPPPYPLVRRPEISPSGFASLLLGISLSMMLCGWVTFVIGFMLMPWILGLVTILYFLGFVSNISGLGKQFCWRTREENVLATPIPIANSINNKRHA